MCFENNICDFFFPTYSSITSISFLAFTLLDFCLQVDVVTPSGEVPVSVCTYRESQDQDHWTIMMERVERVSACLTFSQDVG